MTTTKLTSEIKQACGEKLASELEALRKHRADGGKVAGYMCHAFPTAVAAGLGLWPVRMVCGVSGAAESAGEQIVRADVCPLVKSMLGNVSEKRGLHAEIDLWVGLYTCDQMRRGLDCLASDLGREVHPIQLPATRTEEAAEYYAAQIQRFVANVEAHHGLKFDEEKARRWQEKRLEAAFLLGFATRLGNVAPTDLHALYHLIFKARPFDLPDFLNKTVSGSQAFEAKKKIILTGSPLATEDISILETLEAHGFGVIPLNCTGLNTVEEKTADPADDNLLRSLALGAFNLPPCARARPNAGVFERIGKELESSDADGIIVKCLKFCDNWYTERERLAAAFDVPVLVIDSAYSNGEGERLASRVEAFMETIIM
jgi:benzoyl-CoA reductase/2-hydroxyglutaryl-CoA dehydratase subunit BcrC/BadD/HgdB